MRHAKLIICQFVYTYSVLHGIRYQPSICGWHCHLYLSVGGMCPANQNVIGKLWDRVTNSSDRHSHQSISDSPAVIVLLHSTVR